MYDQTIANPLIRAEQEAWSRRAAAADALASAGWGDSEAAYREADAYYEECKDAHAVARAALNADYERSTGRRAA